LTAVGGGSWSQKTAPAIRAVDKERRLLVARRESSSTSRQRALFVRL
jgi:hypothetical protein